jgi:hypothetical protein
MTRDHIIALLDYKEANVTADWLKSIEGRIGHSRLWKAAVVVLSWLNSRAIKGVKWRPLELGPDDLLCQDVVMLLKECQSVPDLFVLKGNELDVSPSVSDRA